MRVACRRAGPAALLLAAALTGPLRAETPPALPFPPAAQAVPHEVTTPPLRLLDPLPAAIESAVGAGGSVEKEASPADPAPVDSAPPTASPGLPEAPATPQETAPETATEAAPAEASRPTARPGAQAETAAVAVPAEATTRPKPRPVPEAAAVAASLPASPRAPATAPRPERRPLLAAAPAIRESEETSPGRAAPQRSTPPAPRPVARSDAPAPALPTVEVAQPLPPEETPLAALAPAPTYEDPADAPYDPASAPPDPVAVEPTAAVAQPDPVAVNPAAAVSEPDPAQSISPDLMAAATAPARSDPPPTRPAKRQTEAQPEILAMAALTPPPRAIPPGGAQICNDPRLSGQRVTRITSTSSSCGIETPVRITSVSGIRLSTPIVSGCRLGTRLADWVDDTAKPAALDLGTRLTGIDTVASYACRPRNNQRGAKMSEHGKGNAVDIAGFRFADGRSFTVLEGWRAKSQSSFLRRVHANACGTFGTVLGPNSDRFHRNHFHFDVANYRYGPYCK